MTKTLTRTVRLVSLAAIALSLAACEPEEGAQRNLSHFSLAEGEGPFDLGLQDAGPGGGIGDLLPAALPLLAGGGGDYELAPSWDYARGDYVDYAPGDPYAYYGYDEPYGDYYDDGYYDDASYYDDAGYYDQSAGSSDFMWLALAALIAGVIGDSPPDYGFDHYGVQPWAWRTGDGYYRFVEPIYGGNRYYYYAPGAGQPFLVRDPYFSYGYRDDRLVALYDRDGRLMNARAAQRQRRAAQQYLARAEALYQAARADARTGVAVRDWERRRGALAGDQRRWREAKAEQAAWRQWDKQYERGLSERWQRENAAREQAARRVESWREVSYRGPAPRLYARERTEAQRVAIVQPHAEAQRVAIVQPRAEARRTGPEPRQALAQRRETQRDTARSQLALADRRERGRELAREPKPVREARIGAAEQARRRDLAVQREERSDKARGERQRRAAQQDRVRAERQAAAEQQQRTAHRQERVRVERQVSAERQQRATQQKQEKARVERQASAERQQRAAQQQERVRAERRAAQRQQQEQARQVAQQQQRAVQQDRARSEQQAAQRQQQERARQVAQQQRQQQERLVAQQQRQQQQAREAQRAAPQTPAAAQPATAGNGQRGGGRKNGKG